MISSAVFLIVESEILVAETISDFLKKEGCENVLIAQSFKEAIMYIESNKIDFVLTAIAIGNPTGIDLGHLLNSKYCIPFIYITSHTEKAVIEKAKPTRPNAYIVKPFKKEDLLIAIELGLYNTILDQNKNGIVMVKEGRIMVKLYHDHILWLKSEGNYTTIFLKEDNRRVIRSGLLQMQELLPSSCFIRIHKSLLVNKNHIEEIKTNSIIINQTELSVGRTYQQNLVDIFKDN